MSPGGSKLGEFDIQADGTFRVPLADVDGDQMILLLVDTSQADPGDVLGVISLPSGSSASTLDSFLPGEIKGNLELGEVAPDSESDVARVELTIDRAAFKDLEMMEELSVSDNALRLVVNSYQNPGFHAGVHVLFWMPDDLAGLFFTESELDGFVKARDFSGIRPNLLADLDTDITAEHAQDKTKLKLYPPDTVLEFDRFDTPEQYDPTHPMTAAFAEVHQHSVNTSMFMEFPMLQDFPRNHWLFKVGAPEILKGKFIFGPSFPFEGDTPTIPMPQIKPIRTTGNKISGVEVKWYLKKNDLFTEVDDKFLENLIGGYSDILDL